MGLKLEEKSGLEVNVNIMKDVEEEKQPAKDTITKDITEDKDMILESDDTKSHKRVVET